MNKLVEKMGINNVNITKCATSQYGEQEIKQKYGTKQSKDKVSKVR